MNRVINFVRAVLHTALLAVTVIPWALAAVAMRLFGSQKMVYAVCLNWLRLSVKSGTAILGIHNRVTGWENLPTGETDAAILLVKHQSSDTLLAGKPPWRACSRTNASLMHIKKRLV